MSDFRYTGFSPTLIPQKPPLVFTEMQNRISSLGVLPRASLKASTVRAYTEAVEEFQVWVRNAFPTALYPADIDGVLVTYITYMYDDNPRRGSRQRAVNTLCALEFFDARLRYSLKLGRQALEGWNRLVPGQSPPPMSKQILGAICAFFVDRDRPDIAIAIALAHHGYLRALEILSLRACDIAFGGDVRFTDRHHSARAGCVIKDAKTGRDQFVPLSDSHLLGLLKTWVTARNIQGTTHRLFHLSYRQFAQALQKSLAYYGLSHVGYTLHSLRHGGATTDWLHNMPFAEVKLKGRWLSDKSCVRYLQAGKGLLLKLRLQPEQASLIAQHAERWQRSRVGAVRRSGRSSRSTLQETSDSGRR